MPATAGSLRKCPLEAAAAEPRTSGLDVLVPVMHQPGEGAVAPHGGDLVVADVIDEAEGQTGSRPASGVHGAALQEGVPVRHDKLALIPVLHPAVQLEDV